MKRARACFTLSAIALMLSSGAEAYVGPTLGLGVIGTVVAVIAVSLLSLFAFVIMPIRRRLQNSRKKRSDDESEDPQ